MSIVKMQELLEDARKEKYAVGAFNCFNIEMVQGIISAAEEVNYPLILPLAESHIKFSDWELISYIMKNQSEKSTAKIALQLDHSKTFGTVEKALKAGFSTVMFDGYELAFEEKIRQTREIVEMAHASGALVEAPLGKIGTVGKDAAAKYDHDAITDPELVDEFTRKTGVDILAVSVGTMHGKTPGESHLDYDRLEKICQKTDVYISLHGGSGVSDDAYRRAIEIGVDKISIFTRVSTAAVDEIARVLENGCMRFPELLVEAKHGVTKEVARLMRIFANR
ncbi:class II fructose-bisphosphate aldolase [Diplocloster hominis]|uniref:class II fructose-bisphosphate aldolase n=1 Tax=Diplocloster hominis TaxID=3079010 RepID=UPI0031B9CA48